MEYMDDTLNMYKHMDKRDLILFPHRIAPEKHLNIFKDLAARMPEYQWVVCQEQPLSKEQYHTILGESQIVFSANLQETYGISCIEGLICGAFPMVPDRLSYSEMYEREFRYPSEWTDSWDSYIANRHKIESKIRTIMELFAKNGGYMNRLISQQLANMDRFIRATPLFESLLRTN